MIIYLALIAGMLASPPMWGHVQIDYKKNPLPQYKKRLHLNRNNGQPNLHRKGKRKSTNKLQLMRRHRG